ncbi:MAG: DMT family transporter [Prevotellaceae bacterium]|jgi:drug/metabolite transporter (DMT)-like permease|nr:DMT family transporter [Prevotellaceae bacterium]
MKNSVWIYTGILLAIVFWGMSFVWVDQMLGSGFPPFSLLAVRLAISAIVLSLLSLGFGKLQRPEWADLKWIILMALFEPFLYFIGETRGILLTTPTTASVIISTIPLFAMLLGFLVYKERMSKLNVFGAVVAVAGVLLSVLNEEMSIKVDALGVLMLFFAVLSTIGYSLVVKKLASKYNVFTIVVFQNILGTLLFFPFAFSEYEGLRQFAFSLETIYPVLLLALFPSTLSFIFYVNCIHHIGVVRANMFSTLMPVVTLLFASALGRELLTLRNGTGVFIVIAGLLLTQVKKTVNV